MAFRNLLTSSIYAIKDAALFLTEAQMKEFSFLLYTPQRSSHRYIYQLLESQRE